MTMTWYKHFKRNGGMNEIHKKTDTMYFLIVALKIHISRYTKDILDNIGTCTVEERGEITVKVRYF